MKLLSDDMLGFVWSVRSECLELGKQCDLVFNLSDESRRFLPSLIDGFNTGCIPNFGTLKFAVNGETLIRLDALIDSMEQKLSACMDGAVVTGRGLSGVDYLRKKIAKFKTLKRKISLLIGKSKEQREIDSSGSLYRNLYELDDRDNYVIQMLAISSDGFSKLNTFINNYVSLYSSRELEGQELLELPSNYARYLESYVMSCVSKFGSKKIPVNLNKVFMYPVHSILHLAHLGHISIQTIRRQVDAPTSGLGTRYKSLYWEWQAVVDIANRREESKFVVAGIALDCKNATLCVRSTISINPENQEVKLLIKMMSTEGIVQYVDLAKAMGLNALVPGSNNGDVAREVQDRMKILKSMLIDAGMTDDEIRERVVVKNRVGYQLRNVDLNS